KMKPALVESGYIGYIDLNCIVNGNGIYPLEFTSRFGYPTISIQQEAMISPIGEFLAGLARGENVDLKVKKGFQVGVRVVVPPYPFRDKKTFSSYSKRATVVFKKSDNLEGVHIEDLKIVKGEWVVTGNAGVTLIVVGTGLTMKEAQRQVYARIQNILIPNMYYRKDIGDRWFEERDKLMMWDII
ncbi:phosphoribosylamine--glycine ligase, partial [Patescibacteria group bacterium]|nr:phosphoribosylamine--glycine ligase [Patescibacteria group bacterium]